MSDRQRSNQRRAVMAAVLLVVTIFAPIQIFAGGDGADAPSPSPAVTPAGDDISTPDPDAATLAPTSAPDSSLPPDAAPTASPDESAAPSEDPPTYPSPTSRTPVLPSAGPAADSDPYVITFVDGAAFAARGELLAAAGLTETSSVEALGMATVDVPVDGVGALIAGLRADPRIARMEPDRERSVEAVPDDPRYADQWALPRIGWPAVNDDRPAGRAVVAVLDTGVDGSHPDLAGSLEPGVSFVDGVAADTDSNGHGTWMAGIIGAADDNGVGMAGAGLGAVKIMPVTVIGPDGTGRDSDIISGIVYAVDHGADVILMAFSSHGYSAALQQAVDYAWAHDVVIVAAAGNDGSSLAAYPAGDGGVVGVAATTAADTVWPQSNSGADVFLAAPGASIVTTSSDGGYATIDGTSAAAAYVAAAAGLLRAKDVALANGVIVGRLASSAAPLGDAPTTGNGLLDLGRAWNDGGNDSVRPSGAHDGSGGPYVGPYSDPTTNPGPYVVAAAGFRAAAQNGAGSGVTSLAINKPSGTTTGDLMIASIAVRPSTVTITAPAGWTLIRRADQGSGNTNSQAVYYRIATAAEGASYTWTLSAATTGSAGGIATFSDTSSCAPVDVSNGQANASSTSQAAPSVTTTAAGDVLVTGHSFASAASWTPPGGMSEAVDVASIAVPQTAGISLEMNYQLLGAAGATGAKTAVAANDADTGVGVTVALRSSCTKTWDGGAGTNNWGDAANWNPDGVPTGSDIVSLTGANTINANVAATTNDLTLNNASLVLTVNSGQSLTVTGNLTLTAGTLNTQAAFPTVSGTVSIAAGSTVGYTAASGSQTVPVEPYGNLVISGGGTKTLAATITPAGNLTVNGGTLDLSTFSASRATIGGTMTVANGTTLKIGGTGTLPANYATHSIGATSTVEYAGTTTTVAALNSGQSYGNLVVSGSTTTTTASFAVRGTFTVSGSFTPAATSVIGGAGTLTGTGIVRVTRTSATADFVSQYTITSRTLTNLTVEYAGSAAQTVNALAYGGLTINASSGVVLAGNVSATTLNLTSGVATTGTYTLAVASGGTASRINGWVAGNLQRGVAAGSPTLTFDIGDATTYAPVTVAFASVTTPGTVTAKTATGDHAQIATSGIVATRSVNRTWTLTPAGGLAYTSSAITFNFAASDVDAGADPNSFIAARYSSSAWSTLTVSARTATSTQAGGVSAMGDFALGNTDLGIFSANQDVGSPTLAGSASHVSGTYTVSGSGADIWGNGDQFQFIYVPQSGDFRITARVVSVSNTDGWAKAGVMIRESTAAGSVHAFAAMTPSNGMAFQWRPTTNGTSYNVNTGGPSAPYWVRLTKVGNTYTAERSADGVTWTQEGTGQTISMASTLDVGLAVTAHTNGALSTAIFDNVELDTPPHASDDSYSINEDNTLNVAAPGVLANDVDPEGDPFGAIIVSGVSHGSLTLNSNGSFSYAPAANFNGNDSFTYRANDGAFNSTPATVMITVNPVNDAPSFTRGSDQTVNEDSGPQSVSGWATAISAGPADESAQAVDFLVSNGNNGLFSSQPAVSASGALTYTPVANGNGMATITIRAHDDGGTANGGNDTSAAQTFTITVNAVDDAPVNSVPGPQTVGTNGTLIFAAGNGNAISTSDIDAGSSPVRVQLSATNGTLTLSGTAGLAFSVGDGTADATMTFSGTLAAVNAGLDGLTFTPTPLFAGAASVQIVTNDQGATGSGGPLSDTDSVAVTVINTPPVGTPDGYEGEQDNTLVVNAPGVLANDSDVDGQVLGVAMPRPISAPLNGALTLNADGSFTYVPTGGFTGTDSFTYEVSDGIAVSGVTAVVITIDTTAYVSASNWSTSFSASRYLDLTFPAYVAAGATVEGATFNHSYRSYAGGTTCYYFEVWASGVLIGTHGSPGAPVSCNSGSSFVNDAIFLPEINTVSRANAATVRLLVRNSAGGRSEHRRATLSVTYWLGN